MLSDNEIIERGGTEEDIEAYAHDVGGACGAIFKGWFCDYCGKEGIETEEEYETRQREVVGYGN